MKITEIELFRIAIPFKKPYKLSKVLGTVPGGQAVIMKMHTDAGPGRPGRSRPHPAFHR